MFGFKIRYNRDLEVGIFVCLYRSFGVRYTFRIFGFLESVG